MLLTEKIKNAVNESTKSASGMLGFGFYDLNTGEECYINKTTAFPTASVYKTFTLLELMRQVNNNTLCLNTRYELKKDFQTLGSGILANINSGTSLTLYDYAVLMMIISDNTAADFLYNLVGSKNIKNNVIDFLELSNTKADLTCTELIYRYCGFSANQSASEMMNAYYNSSYRNNPWFLCKTEENCQTTPEDMTKVLKTVYLNQWENENVCSTIINIMKQCQTNSRIPKYLPPDVSVAHKTGSLDRVGNDAGIIYTERGNYILTLFYNGNASNENEYLGVNSKGFFGDELLANLSLKIYEIYTGRGEKDA